MHPTRTCPIPPPRPSKARNIKETSTHQQKQPIQVHPDPTPVRRPPLLPTPPAPARQFNNRNHYRQFISRPLPPRHNINSTFSGQSTLNNNRFHQQPHIPGPYQQSFTRRPYPQPQGHQQPALLPLPSHQIPTFSGPYQHASAHTPQQVLIYLPVCIPYPHHLTSSLLYVYTV